MRSFSVPPWLCNPGQVSSPLWASLLTDFTNDRHKLSSVFPKSGCVPESSEKLFIHFTFFGQTHGIRKFSGQVSSLRHSSDLSHGSDNAGSLTLWSFHKETPRALILFSYFHCEKRLLSVNTI